MQYTLGDYAAALYQAETLDVAFSAFEQSVFEFGFEGVLYSYIPKALQNSNFHVQPCIRASTGFSPGYLSHYFDAHLYRHDPVIRAVSCGETGPIDWWGDKCERYKQADKASRDVIELSRSYGIRIGLTIPLMCGEQGIAGASFTSGNGFGFSVLPPETLDALTLRAKMFHSLVVSNAGYLREFTKPLTTAFSQTQLRYLSGLAVGKTTANIAREMGTTPGYLDQSLIRIRRKLSGTRDGDTPSFNRNRLLYYAGLLNILEKNPND